MVPATRRDSSEQSVVLKPDSVHECEQLARNWRADYFFASQGGLRKITCGDFSTICIDHHEGWRAIGWLSIKEGRSEAILRPRLITPRTDNKVEIGS